MQKSILWPRILEKYRIIMIIPMFYHDFANSSWSNHHFCWVDFPSGIGGKQKSCQVTQAGDGMPKASEARGDFMSKNDGKTWWTIPTLLTMVFRGGTPICNLHFRVGGDGGYQKYLVFEGGPSPQTNVMQDLEGTKLHLFIPSCSPPPSTRSSPWMPMKHQGGGRNSWKGVGGPDGL